MKKNVKSQNVAVGTDEPLIAAIMDFYIKHPGYRISQSEFASLVCALSQQFMHDI